MLRRYSQVIGDVAAGKQTQTALRSPLAGAGGPYHWPQRLCERQDDPTADGPHPVWTSTLRSPPPRHRKNQVNQNDTRSALEADARSTYNAYWDVQGRRAQAAVPLPVRTSDVSTKLNQEDLQSRDDEFKSAASAMSEKVMPCIKR